MFNRSLTKIFTLSLSFSSVQGKKEILGYSNTGEGISREKTGKLIICIFIFNFITINETLKM
jgi:hypothetical protein